LTLSTVVLKLPRYYTFIVLALCIAFFAARGSRANPVHETSGKDDLYIQELDSLQNYLNDTGQTNALRQLNHILAHNRAMQDDVDLSMTVTILQGLRDGKTNEMLRFFENRLDARVAVFGSEYHALPIAYQKQMNLKPLQRAWDYRAKFPLMKPDPVWGVDMTNAFQILDGK
jgi:hypothetical protein